MGSRADEQFWWQRKFHFNQYDQPGHAAEFLYASSPMNLTRIYRRQNGCEASSYLLFVTLLFYVAGLVVAQSEPQTIISGIPWNDQNGVNVQGHGGNIIKAGSTYYWFGENKTNETAQHDPFHSVRCYSSTDLAHWT